MSNAARLETPAIRHLGTCPVCQLEFKARGEDRDLRMVHHGYRRPGWGRIVGDCFGVHHAPYEISAKGCEAWKAVCLNSIVGLTAYLTRLHGPEAGWPEMFTRASFRRGRPGTTYHRDAPGERLEYDSLRRAAIHETEARIRNLDAEVTRMETLIAAWGPKVVKAWSEEIEAAQIKADREARAAVLTEKRAAKAAKRAAIDAKATALEAKRAALKAGLDAEFAALAKEPPSAERFAKVCALIKKFDTVKYRWMAAYELAPEPLITLGLAERGEHGHLDLRKFHAVRS
jgi:hypothetical protein